MQKNHHEKLRSQIAHKIAEPVAPFEREIANSLIQAGEFRGELDREQLATVMRKVLYTLVAEQKVAGIEVPIVHNVPRMEVAIANCEARVFAEVHIHSPIIAFIQFEYVLENDHRAPGQRLRLKNDHLEEKEVTRPFDLGAKAALAIMGVRQIALHELRDPNGVILRTLPHQLEPLGYDGILSEIALEITAENTMAVHLRGGQPDRRNGPRG